MFTEEDTCIYSPKLVVTLSQVFPNLFPCVYILASVKMKQFLFILKESIRKRIFSPVHIHLVVTVRVTTQIPTIYPIISTQSSIENYAKMRLESRRLSPYLFTCDVTHSLSD